MFALALVWMVERFCHKQTRGFTLLKIASDSAMLATDEIDFWSPEKRSEIDAILTQSFTFLNSGGQCYAFVSQDGKTILKLFKHHHIRMWNFLNRIPFPRLFHASIRTLLEKKIHQSPQFFESCTIAYEHFRERSALIYLHLNKTRHFKKKLSIIDKLGITHLIDLDTTDFALQKRVELSHNKFKDLIQNHDFDTAKACIDSAIALIIERSQKGIVDRDPNMRRNIGFLGTQAVEIDLGSFTRIAPIEDPDLYQKEVQLRTQKFYRWLSKHEETLAQYLEEKTLSLSNSYPSSKIN